MTPISYFKLVEDCIDRKDLLKYIQQYKIRRRKPKLDILSILFFLEIMNLSTFFCSFLTMVVWLHKLKIESIFDINCYIKWVHNIGC